MLRNTRIVGGMMWAVGVVIGGLIRYAAQMFYAATHHSAVLADTAGPLAVATGFQIAITGGLLMLLFFPKPERPRTL